MRTKLLAGTGRRHFAQLDLPSLQLGGTYAVENLRRVKAAEHFAMLAQLAPMNAVELTQPEPPRFPYCRHKIVRRIGREK